MTRYEHPGYAPTVKRKMCKRCGDMVDTFKDPETGLIRQLNTRAISAAAARMMWRTCRAWIDRGPRIGWCLVSYPDIHETRELRFAHECEEII